MEKITKQDLIKLKKNIKLQFFLDHTKLSKK